MRPASPAIVSETAITAIYTVRLRKHKRDDTVDPEIEEARVKAEKAAWQEQARKQCTSIHVKTCADFTFVAKVLNY